MQGELLFVIAIATACGVLGAYMALMLVDYMQHGHRLGFVKLWFARKVIDAENRSMLEEELVKAKERVAYQQEDHLHLVFWSIVNDNKLFMLFLCGKCLSFWTTLILYSYAVIRFVGPSIEMFCVGLVISVVSAYAFVR